jgi:outer membrane protein OmpA-like peptidoglycan-associated protein
MQIQLGLYTLLFAIFNMGLPTISLAACADYEIEVNQAVKNQNLEALEKLLPQLNSQQAACSPSYLKSVKRSMAQIVARKANGFMQRGQLAQAEAWLERAPTEIWNTFMIRGNINAQRDQWTKAVQFFNQALDLIDDPELTPQAPTHTEIENLYQLVSVAQSFVGDLDIALRGSVRGVPRRRIVPILFDYGETTLNKKGKKLARHLARYIKQRKVNQVTLIGHTDSKGSPSVNQKVSKQRADSVKNYLQDKLDVTANLKTIGKGKNEPLRLLLPWKLPPERIAALSRRVEFKTK